MLGDAHGGVRRAAAHHGALVACRDDGDGLGHAFGADRVLQEFAHLAAALADQRDDDRVEGGGRGEHGEQRRLADAGAGEDAEPLAEADRRENVDDLDAGREGVADALARQRRRLGDTRCIVGIALRKRAARRRSDGRARRWRGRATRRAAGSRTGPRSMTASPTPASPAALERRDQHLVGRDLHDLAVAQAGAAAMLDHVAEPRDLRQAAYAEMGRRDFGDAAAAAHQRVLVGDTAPGALQRLERVVLRLESEARGRQGQGHLRCAISSRGF